MKLKAYATMTWSGIAYLILWMMPKRLIRQAWMYEIAVWLYGESSFWGYGVTVSELCEWGAEAHNYNSTP